MPTPGKGGGKRSSFHWQYDTLTPGIKTAPFKILAAIGTAVEYEANEAQNHLRINAPWTDRTANARQGLFARAFSEKTKFVLVMYHTMPYGIWLEVKHSGRYAIIVPSMPTVGRNVMRAVSQAMKVAG